MHMLKIALVNLIGFAVLGWFIANPNQVFDSNPPPVIRADAGPIKHRPDGYVAARNKAWAAPVSARQDRNQPDRQTTQDASAIDINLILAR